MKYAILFLSILFLSCDQDPLIDKVDTANDEFFKDGEVEIIFENDTNNGINVIFMGDAYLEADLGKTYGSYRDHARENIRILFETPPFSEYKEHFNAYIVYVESQDDEISLPDGSITNTAFGAQITGGGPNGLSVLRITDYDNLDQYVSKVTNSPRTEKELILMSVNNAGRGSAGLESNLAVFGSGRELTMLHEVGHAFAGLGDEYQFEGYVNDGDTQRYPNLDRTNDLELVKWAHFIGLDGYANVAAFEGGFYTPEGVWRFEQRGLMRSSSSEGYFNAPSREAFVQRIMELRNINYSFAAFLEIDQVSLQTIYDARSQNTMMPESIISCANFPEVD